MSLKYLPEHAQAARFALDLAHRQAEHLRYSQSRLFEGPIDLEWVQNLDNRPDLAEKVEVFISRFGRLQDHLGDKLLPRFAALVGENSKTLLDTLAIAERADWLPSAEAFIAARKYAIHWCMSICRMPGYFWKACLPPTKPATCYLPSSKTLKQSSIVWVCQCRVRVEHRHASDSRAHSSH